MDGKLFLLKDRGVIESDREVEYTEEMMHGLKKFFRGMRSQPYQPLISVEIYKTALRENIRAFKDSYEEQVIIPVLKSNAYGHGIREVGKIMEEEGVELIAIDSLYEAHILRKVGIQTPLLILGYTPPENILRNQLELIHFVVGDRATLSELERAATRPLRCHIKIDTGMHRQGFLPSELPFVRTAFEQNTFLKCEGLCSHLADADNTDTTYTDQQLAVWDQACNAWKEQGELPRYLHIVATMGTQHVSKTLYSNAIRLGLGLYGIAPEHPIESKLTPALQMSARIAYSKHIGIGESIGYNHTYTASRPIQTAIVPAGYFEGVDRRLSNKGHMLIHDIKCPIVGRVSMNISVIDISHVDSVQADDQIVIISSKKGSCCSVEKIAETCQTIPYEILVHIPPHLRRTVV